MRTRYRWWLILACLAAAAGAISWWQLSASLGGRIARERYDRIRLGMTPGEVVESMGRSYSYRSEYGLGEINPHGNWKTVAKAGEIPLLMLNGWRQDVDQVEAWCDDESVGIWVFYRSGKAIMKQLRMEVVPWKIKAQKWLDRLRRFMRW